MMDLPDEILLDARGVASNLKPGLKEIPVKFNPYCQNPVGAFFIYDGQLRYYDAVVPRKIRNVYMDEIPLAVVNHFPQALVLCKNYIYIVQRTNYSNESGFSFCKLEKRKAVKYWFSFPIVAYVEAGKINLVSNFTKRSFTVAFEGEISPGAHELKDRIILPDDMFPLEGIIGITSRGNRILFHFDDDRALQINFDIDFLFGSEELPNLSYTVRDRCTFREETKPFSIILSCKPRFASLDKIEM